MNMTIDPTRVAIVLLVEDDPGDQELTRRALSEDVIKTDLHIVNNGAEAMDYLTHQGKYTDPQASPMPDLILLDLNMPKMDGRQVLQKLSDDPDLKAIPVVVLTTSSQEEEVVRSYKLGCNSFITKPVQLEKFIKIIRELESYWFTLVALPRKAN